MIAALTSMLLKQYGVVYWNLEVVACLTNLMC